MQAPQPYPKSTGRRDGSFIYARKNRGQVHVDESSHPAASLWTHYILKAIRKAQCPRNRFWQHRVRVPRRSSLREELKLWDGLTQKLQEGPFYLANHFVVVLTRATSDASYLAWGGVLRFASLVFQAGADFGPE